MKRRITILYLLTIAGIIAFVFSEAYWLQQRYLFALDEQAESECARIVTTLDSCFTARRKYPRNNDILYELTYNLIGDSTSWSVMMIEMNHVAQQFWAKQSPEEQARIRDMEQLPEGFTRYHFTAIRQCDIYQGIEHFIMRKDAGYTVDTLRRIFASATHVQFSTHETYIWEVEWQKTTSLWRPQVTVVYPFSQLEGLSADITVDISVNRAMRSMLTTLLLSLIIALLLTICLLYQLATIRRQQQIADLQRNFTLTMLHELKRPIGALKLFFSFMRHKHLTEADREEALVNATRELDNLSSYFNKMRAITYNEASEIPLAISTFPLRKALEESAAMVAEADVTLRGEDTMMIAERQSFINVFCNLFENAVKYSDAASPIEVAWESDADGVTITVSDRGQGIADADKRRIFEPFYRVHNNADIPGVGLGLSYVRQILTAHGATINVTDREGGGSVFHIHFPQ